MTFCGKSQAESRLIYGHMKDGNDDHEEAVDEKVRNFQFITCMVFLISEKGDTNVKIVVQNNSKN